MATVNYVGRTPAVAQIITFTISANDVATTYKVTRNGKTVSVVGNAGGVNSTATDLKVALAASTIGEFAEITWTVNSATITGTTTTAGVPSTFTTSVSAGTGTISAVSIGTTATGPNDANAAGNYLSGSTYALPVNGDDLVIDGTVDLLYNLGSLSAVALNSLTIPSTFTAKMGLPADNVTGKYAEDRPTYFKIGATTVTVGAGSGNGSPRIKLDTSSGGTALTVWKTGINTDLVGLEAFLWKGTGTNTIEVYGGTVGLAVLGGDTATVATIQIGGTAVARSGSGVTLTTVKQSGGTLSTYSAFTTGTITAGTWHHFSGAVTTLNVNGGTTYYRSSGTVTTLNGNAGILDCTLDSTGRTVTNSTFNAGFDLEDPLKTITFTNATTYNGTIGSAVGQIKVNRGPTGTVLFA